MIICRRYAITYRAAHYGVRGIEHNWFASCLTNRTQFVSVNGYISDYLEIYCGVSQGSVFGPFLYIYISDLPNISKFLSFYFFADALISILIRQIQLHCKKL